jgi:hypothetical protein
MDAISSILDLSTDCMTNKSLNLDFADGKRADRTAVIQKEA